MLSFKKLKKLLEHNNFVIISILTIEGMCTYIELLSVTSADTFLLYIPSKYDIKVTDDITEPIYQLKYVEINELDKSPTDDLDNSQLEDLYNEIEIDTHKSSENIEENLEEK